MIISDPYILKVYNGPQLEYELPMRNPIESIQAFRDNKIIVFVSYIPMIIDIHTREQKLLQDYAGDIKKIIVMPTGLVSLFEEGKIGLWK